MFIYFTSYSIRTKVVDCWSAIARAVLLALKIIQHDFKAELGQDDFNNLTILW